MLTESVSNMLVIRERGLILCDDLPPYADQQHWAAKEAEAQGRVVDSESLFLPSKARMEWLIIRGHQGCIAHSQES